MPSQKLGTEIPKFASDVTTVSVVLPRFNPAIVPKRTPKKAGQNERRDGYKKGDRQPGHYQRADRFSPDELIFPDFR